MPQLQSIVLTDRTPTTPANLTFVPRDINAGIGTVVNNAGVSVGEKKLRVSLLERNGKMRGEVRLDLPVVATETINGISVPKVVRTISLSLVMQSDKTATEQERNDAVGLMASALASGKVLVNDALVKNEGVY